jgi:hypothetical protein
MDRIYQVDILTPSGTAVTAPLTTQVPLENAILVDVEVFIPPGHAGLTGIHIRQSAQQVIPFGSLAWIIADNYNRIFPVNTEIGSRSISVRTYNTDVFDHTFYVRFHIQDLNTTGSQTPSISAGDLSNVITEGFTSDTPLGDGGTTPGAGDTVIPPPPPPPPSLTLPPPP